MISALIDPACRKGFVVVKLALLAVACFGVGGQMRNIVDLLSRNYLLPFLQVLIIVADPLEGSARHSDQ